MRRGANVEYTTPLPYVMEAIGKGCKHFRWQITGDTRHGQQAYRESLMFLAGELKLKMSMIHPHADVAVALMDPPPEIEELPLIWRDLAGIFHGVPGIFGLDLLNEPKMQAAYWRRLATDTIKAVKKVSRQRCIVQCRKGEPGKLRELMGVPADILSVHVYSPMSFTHQGLYSYPHPVALKLQTLNSSLDNLEKTAAGMKKPLYVGEFSCISGAPGEEKWLNTVIAKIKKNKWHSAAHAWCPPPCPWEFESPSRAEIIQKYWK